MEIRATMAKNRKLSLSDVNIAVAGDNESTTLIIAVPDDLKGYQCRVEWQPPKGNPQYLFADNFTLEIPYAWTLVAGSGKLQIVMVDDAGQVVAKSTSEIANIAHSVFAVNETDPDFQDALSQVRGAAFAAAEPDGAELVFRNMDGAEVGRVPVPGGGGDGGGVYVVQSTGQSTVNVMSQKAVTDQLTALQSKNAEQDGRLNGFREAVHVLVADSQTQDAQIIALENGKASLSDVNSAVVAEGTARALADSDLETKIAQVEAKVDNVPVTYPFATFDDMLIKVGNADGYFQYYPWDTENTGPTVPLYPGDPAFIAELKVNDTFVVEDIRVINDYYWNGQHAIEYESTVDLSNYATKDFATQAAAGAVVTANAHTDGVAATLQPKEAGKGLSTNDFGNAEKSKLVDIQPLAVNAATVETILADKGYATTTYVDGLVGDIDAALTAILGV